MNSIVNLLVFRRKYLWCLSVAAIIEAIVFYYLVGLDRPFPFGNDNLRFYLPQRAFVSDWIQEGHFPWWNPYSGGGAPTNTLYIPQALSPVALVLSLFQPYSANSLVVEILSLNVIAFLGMYCWVRLHCSRIAAYVAAYAYSLTPFMLIQSLLNIEAVGSACALPWIALGVQLIFQRNKRGEPLLCGGLALAFTSGYLGINYFFLVFLLFSLGLYIYLHLLVNVRSSKIDHLNNSRPHLKKIWLIAKVMLLWCFPIAPLLTTGLYFIVFTVVKLHKLKQHRINAVGYYLKVVWCYVRPITLGAVIIAPLIYETFRNFDTSFFIKRGIDPFFLSMKLDSIATLLDTKGVSLYDIDSYGAYTTFFFIPSLLLFGVLCSFLRPTTFIASLGISFCVVFCAALSGQYALTKFIIANIPGFNDIRIHSWLMPGLLLLLLTIGAHGIDQVRSRSRMGTSQFFRAAIFYILFISLYYIVNSRSLVLDVEYLLVTIGCGSLGTLVAIFILRTDTSAYLRVPCSIVIIAIAIYQINLAGNRWDRTSLDERLAPETHQAGLAERYKKDRLPLATTHAIRDVTSVDDASPYLLKRPVVDSYMPQRNPAFTYFIVHDDKTLLSHYTLTLNREPIKSQNLWKTPDTLEIDWGEHVQSAPVLVTIPFSSNWVASSGDRSFSVAKGFSNFLQVNIDAPITSLRLTYATQVSNILLMLSIIGWIVVGIWLIWSFSRERDFRTTLAIGLSYVPSTGLSKHDRTKETQGAFG